MATKIFLDTNILIYAFDKRSPQKQEKAHQLVRSLIQQRSGVISTQVLQEFASVALTKLNHPIEVVIQELTVLESFEVISIVPKLIHRGIEYLEKFTVHFWDAIILAAAEEAQCDTVYSEDFANGSKYHNLCVLNPLL